MSLLVFDSLFIVGCSTTAEIMSGTGGGYRATKDSDGHTKYTRTRTLTPSDTYNSTPIYTGTPYSYDYGHNHQHIPENSLVRAVVDTAATVSELAVLNATQDYNSSGNEQLYQTAAAAFDSSGDSNPYSGSGLAFGIYRSNETASGDISYEWMSEYVSGGVGIAFVSSDRTYFGFNGGIRIHYPWIVSPYVGLGAYGGDSKACSYEPKTYGTTEETCDKYFLFAGTADLGLQFNFDKNFVVRAFARGFSQTRQGDPLGETLYGTSFAFVF